MSDDSSVSAIMFGAFIFAILGGCDKWDSGSYQLVTSGDVVYRIHKSNGEIAVVTKDGIEPVRETRRLHFWERGKIPIFRIWPTLKIAKDLYTCSLKTQWINEQLFYQITVSPPPQESTNSANLEIQLMDVVGMKRLEATVYIGSMTKSVNENGIVTSLNFQGIITTNEQTLKDISWWTVVWSGIGA